MSFGIDLIMADDNSAIAVADPFARRLMAKYLERRERELTTLSLSLADRDYDAIALTAHKLYGSGSAYGLDEVTRIGGELEAAANSRELPAVTALIQELEDYVGHVKLAK